MTDGRATRRSRDSVNRYSIDMLLPGLSGNSSSAGGGSSCTTSSALDGKDSRESRAGENVFVMSESSSSGSGGGGGGRKEINRMPSGSSMKRKDGGEWNDDNGGYLSTPLPTAPAIYALPARNGTTATGRTEDQQEKGGTNNMSKANTTTNSGKKRAGTSPLKPTTQAKHMLLSDEASAAAPAAVAPTPTSLLLAPGMEKMSKKNMLEAFQPWVLQAYGDSAKTKTITKKKYYRIVKTLRGEEINNAENSKFRFWVKAKGFHIGLPPGHSNERSLCSSSYSNEPDLFVPTTVKDASSDDKPVYKRVAVVEHFFDIIYTVHVETEAKNGKHAGQKRTYRAITEKYAFLPREAVTKFLLQCMECQKRGSPAAGSELPPTPATVSTAGKKAPEEPMQLLSEPNNKGKSRTGSKCSNSSKYSSGGGGGGGKKASGGLEMNFSLPFTTTYLREQEKKKEKKTKNKKRMVMTTMVSSSNKATMATTRRRKRKKKDDDDDDEEEEADADEGREKGWEDYDDADDDDGDDDGDDEEEDEDAHLSDATGAMDTDEPHEHGAKARNGDGGGKGGVDSEHGVGGTAGAVDWLGYHPIGLKKEPPPPPPPAPSGHTTTTTTNNNIYSNGKHDFREQSSPLSLSDRSSGVNHEAGQDETSSNGNKDDEDDDDDESEDKIDTQQHDPERLKAFNMFVRLFVDENLDRMVPISKQPKEKIQAIIDSCTRQFPEFAERARKRIRTYLKSCRRNKRSRDSNGWESTRPTPAHLTSVQAEQILAQACENESQNAKRMRMGLEPVGQPLPLPLQQQQQQQQQQQNDRSNSTSEVVENGHHHHGRSTTGSTRERGSSRVVQVVQQEDSESKNSSRMASPAVVVEPERNSKSSLMGAASSLPAPVSSSPGIASAAAVAAAAAVAPAAAVATAAISSPELMTHNSLGSSQNSGHAPIPATAATPASTLARAVASTTPSAPDTPFPSGGIQTAPKAHERSSAVDYSRAMNGSGVPNMSIFRPNLGQPFPRPAPFTALFPPGAAASAVTAATTTAGLPTFTPHSALVNDSGPTDLSMKAKPLLTHKLTTSEIATVRQLITGYRESAAFLLRSADELEQLLIQQQQ